MSSSKPSYIVFKEGHWLNIESTKDQDNALLNFVKTNSSQYYGLELFSKARKQCSLLSQIGPWYLQSRFNSIQQELRVKKRYERSCRLNLNNHDYFDLNLAESKKLNHVEIVEKPDFDIEPYSKYHRHLTSLFTEKPSDDAGFKPKEDRALLNFVMTNSKKFDRLEVFQRARKNEPSLRKKTSLGLYLRYHCYLYPLFTGKQSDEIGNFLKRDPLPSENYLRRMSNDEKAVLVMNDDVFCFFRKDWNELFRKEDMKTGQ